MRLRHSREYRYPLVSVFLPFCQRHQLSDLSQVNPRVLDRLTGELLENGNKHSELSRHTIGSYLRSVNVFLTWAKAEGEAVLGKGQASQAEQAPPRGAQP